MNLKIETIKTAGGGRVDAIRDIATVRRLIAVAEKAMHSIRDFPCGHKPNGVSGVCDACEALNEWDALSANDPS
jgi:hypothetical protein